MFEIRTLSQSIVSLIFSIICIFSADASDQNIPTVSARMLGEFLGKSIHTCTPDDIQKFLKNRKNPIKYTQKNCKQLASIIEEEKKHPNKYFAYHATNSLIWFLHRTLSIMRYQGEDESKLQTNVMRPLGAWFKDFQSVQDVWKIPDRGINDHHAVLRRRFLAANTNILGGFHYNSKGESSIRRFLSGNRDMPFDSAWRIIEVLFEELGVPAENLIQKLADCYQKHFPSDTSVLLQIAFNKNFATSNCCISEPYGHATYTHDHGPEMMQKITNALPILEALKKGKDPKVYGRSSAGREIWKFDRNDIQLRILANFTDDVIIREYFNTEEGQEINLKTVDHNIKNILEQFLSNLQLQTNPKDLLPMGNNNMSWKNFNTPKSIIVVALEKENYLEAFKEILLNKELNPEEFYLPADSRKLHRETISQNIFYKFLVENTLEYNTKDELKELFTAIQNFSLEKVTQGSLHYLISSFNSAHYRDKKKVLEYTQKIIDLFGIHSCDFAYEVMKVLNQFRAQHYPDFLDALNEFSKASPTQNPQKIIDFMKCVVKGKF